MLSVNVRYKQKLNHSPHTHQSTMFLKPLQRNYLISCLGMLLMTACPSIAQLKAERPNLVVVMLGDSITHAGPWKSLFPNTQIINRGISGYSTHDLLREMSSTIALGPGKIFLMIGINDLLRGASVEETFNRYILILNALEKSGAKVFVEATLECAREQCGATVDAVRALNQRLKNTAQERALTFIDLNPGLTDQTRGLLKLYTTDGLHLTTLAYTYWAKAIANMVREE